MDRMQLLFVSPVIPALTGNGLAMRAGMTLLALSQHYDIDLMVTNQFVSPSGHRLHPDLEHACRDFDLGQLPGRRTSGEAFGSRRYDVVHVFRRGTIDRARHWLDTAGSAHLDLDDIESVTSAGIASLYRQRGYTADAGREERAAESAREAERAALWEFDRVYVCSTLDAGRLPPGGRAQIDILPNAVIVPGLPIPLRQNADVFTMLFVGTLGYFPNEDGLIAFTEETLPRLRESAVGRFRLQVVGSGRARAAGRIASVPEIDFQGYAASVLPWYEAADAIIVPLRAGGGTRIKILEAFALGRPVVSTSLGSEGIDARDGEHALIADDPVAFARACLELMNDDVLRQSLVDAARDLVTSRYSLDAMTLAVAPQISPPPPL
jgi:polysaccharide biosynthesis protein PslH